MTDLISRIRRIDLKKINIETIKRDRRKLLYYLSAALLAAVVIIILIIMHKRMPYMLDSNMSSELLLSKRLSEEQSVLSKSWYYSTEIRVLNTQLIYSFFFNFTDNWHTVRMLSSAVMLVMLCACTVFLCRKAGCPKYGFLTAVCMMTALSATYYRFVIVGCYYIPHIVISFLTLAFVFMYLKPDSRRKRFLLASAVLSLIAGMGGMRQLVVTYIPLALAVILIAAVMIYQKGLPGFRGSDHYHAVIISLADLAAGVTGYLINSRVLAKIYKFKAWDDIKFTKFDFDRLRTVFCDFFTLLGYTTGKITLKTIFCNCAFFAIFGITVWAVIAGLRKKAGRELRLITVFFLCGMSVFTAIYTLTDMKYMVRYMVPVVVFVFPMAAMALHEADSGKLPRNARQAAMILLIAAVLGRGAVAYNGMRHQDQTKGIREIAAYLKASEYRNGYSTFWNGNVITELSNGEVTLYTWFGSSGDTDGSSLEKTTELDDLFEWLQYTDHMDSPPQGKVFVVYKNNEIEYAKWKDALRDSDIIFTAADYTVYGYDSYDDVKALYDKYCLSDDTE